MRSRLPWPASRTQASGVELRPRETEAGATILANFALHVGRRTLEFAARSEEEAREWVRALDEMLFRHAKLETTVRV